MYRISNCIHIPARNHACITTDPWQRQAIKTLVPCATRWRTTGRIVGWYFVAGLHYYAYMFCLRHTILCPIQPQPNTVHWATIVRYSRVCLISGGWTPESEGVRSSVQMIPHEEFDGSAKDSFFIIVPLYLPYSFSAHCTLHTPDHKQ